MMSNMEYVKSLYGRLYAVVVHVITKTETGRLHFKPVGGPAQSGQSVKDYIMNVVPL